MVLLLVIVQFIWMIECGGIIDDRKKAEEEFTKKSQTEQVSELIKNVARTYNNLVGFF